MFGHENDNIGVILLGVTIIFNYFSVKQCGKTNVPTTLRQRGKSAMLDLFEIFRKYFLLFHNFAGALILWKYNEK